MTSKKETRGGTQKMPYAFSEHGVTILASVLRSKKASDMNVAIVRTFIAMRHIANGQLNLAQQLQELKIEMQTRLGEHDTQLSSIYDALENMLDKKQTEMEVKEIGRKGQGLGLRNDI